MTILAGDLPDSERDKDLESRQKIAQQVFDTVLKANEHQDNKANRIISSIAFILAASVTILVFTLPASGNPPRANPLFASTYFLHVHPALLSFSIFLILVLSGVVCYLNALGPSFNWPKTETSDVSDKRSTLLFFEVVAKYDVVDLEKYFLESSRIELRERIIFNLLNESILIAQKTTKKVDFMKYGSLCFRFGLPLSIPLILSNYSTQTGFTVSTFSISLALSYASLVWARHKPSESKK